MSDHSNRAVVFESSDDDLEAVRKVLAKRDCGEVVHLRWTESNKLLSNGGSMVAVVPVEQDDDTGIGLIEAIRRSRPEIPVIASGPEAEPELILRAMRAGANEYLLRPFQPAELGRALDRVLEAAGNDVATGKTIAVYSAKGGLGSTTVAVNLAFALSRGSGQRAALVDLVVQNGDVRVFLDIKPTHTIRDLTEQVGSLDKHSMISLLHSCPDRVWVCADPNMPDEAELLTGRRVATVLRRISNEFAYTVIDCEHALNERTLAALDLADRIILLTHLTVPAVRSLQRTLDLFARLEYGSDKVSVVVNRLGSKGDLSLSDIEKVLDRPIDASLPNDYRATINAAARGEPIYQIEPKAKIVAALDEFAARLGAGSNGSNGRGGSAVSPVRRLFGR